MPLRLTFDALRYKTIKPHSTHGYRYSPLWGTVEGYEPFRAIEKGPLAMYRYLADGGSFAPKLRRLRILRGPSAFDPDRKPMCVPGETLGMLAASKGAEQIRIFHEGGGRFDLARDGLNRDAGWYAVYAGLDAMRAFVACGGKFTDAQDIGIELPPGGKMQKVPGSSTEMLAFHKGREAAEIYLANGGTIARRSLRDCFEGSAAMIAMQNGLSDAELFIRNGGRFEPRDGWTAVNRGVDMMRFFREHGGKYEESGALVARIREKHGNEGLEEYLKAQGKPLLPARKGARDPYR